MIGSILDNIIANLVGQGLDEANERARVKWGRLPFIVIGVGLSLYLVVASIFLWQSPAYPGMQGLVQLASAWPWMWLVPALAGLTTVLLLIPVAGRLIFALLSAIAMAGVGLGALITLQGSTSDITDLPTNISTFGTFITVLAALFLALQDRPGLSSPLAAFAIPYSMRLNHLRALRQFGTERGWQVVGPTGSQNTLRVDGAVSPTHPIFITSSMRFRMSQDKATDGAILTVAIRSAFDIPGFYSGPKRLEPAKRGGLAEIEVPIPGKPSLFAYVQPYPELPLTPAVAEQIAGVIRARPGALPSDAIVQATPLGMRVRYTRFYRRLTAKDGRPEPILQWLDQLVTTLEPISPRLSDAELAQRWQAFQPKM